MLNGLVGMLGGGVAAVGDFDSIATYQVGAGGQADITFSSIPSTYKHLQIRAIARSTAGGSAVTQVRCTINSGVNADRNHWIYGNGQTPSATAQVGNLIGFATGNTQTSNAFGATIIDILDYAHSNKNKVFRSLSGDDVNGGGDIFFASLLYATTTAISTLTFTLDLGNFAQYSHFALYGIKA